MYRQALGHGCLHGWCSFRLFFCVGLAGQQSAADRVQFRRRFRLLPDFQCLHSAFILSWFVHAGPHTNGSKDGAAGYDHDDLLAWRDRRGRNTNANEGGRIDKKSDDGCVSRHPGHNSSTRCRDLSHTPPADKLREWTATWLQGQNESELQWILSRRRHECADKIETRALCRLNQGLPPRHRHFAPCAGQVSGSTTSKATGSMKTYVRLWGHQGCKGHHKRRRK